MIKNRSEILFEDYFATKVNNSKLKQIDAEFQKILDSYNFERKDFNMDFKGFKKAEENISKICKELFNANMKLKFIDYNNKFQISSVAYTTIYHEDVNKIMQGLKTIIIEEKSGVYYSEPAKVEVFFEKSAIRAFMQERVVNRKFEAYNGRLLTAVLLHELGHNLFLPIEINILSHGETPVFEMVFNDNPPIQFEYAKEDIEGDLKNGDATAGLLSFALVLQFCLLTVAVTPFLLGTFFTSTILNIILGYRRGRMNYNLSERTANQLPSIYGYGSEMIIFYDLIRDKFNIKPKKNNRLVGAIFRLLRPLAPVRSYKSYDLDSVDTIIKTLEFEANNSNNTPEMRKAISKQLEDINETIRLSKNLEKRL